MTTKEEKSQYYRASVIISLIRYARKTFIIRDLWYEDVREVRQQEAGPTPN